MLEKKNTSLAFPPRLTFNIQQPYLGKHDKKDNEFVTEQIFEAKTSLYRVWRFHDIRSVGNHLSATLQRW